MSHDIYPSLSGAMATWQQVEIIANNLSNANTTGFKQTRASFENVMTDLRPLGDGFTRLRSEGVELTDGPIVQTGVHTHVALQGDGFLLVEGADGEQYLSRDGNLRLDAQRFIVNQRNERVLGGSGPIRVPQDEQVEIDIEGNVTTRRNDGTDVMVNQVGRLRLVTADAVESRGGSHFVAVDGFRDATDVSVINGALEQSNTNPMVGMVDLIQASRYFDIYQRAIRTSDEMDGNANQMARS